MEVVLETADYQNFLVRYVPATLSPGAVLTACRILHLKPSAGPELATPQIAPAGDISTASGYTSVPPG